MKYILSIALLLILAACGGGKTAQEKEREEKYEAIKAEASVFEKDWLALGDMVKGLGPEIGEAEMKTQKAVAVLEEATKNKAAEIDSLLNNCKTCNETLAGIKSAYTARLADWNKAETDFNTWTATFSQDRQNLDSATKMLKGFKNTMESFQNEYNSWKATLSDCADKCVNKFNIQKR